MLVNFYYLQGGRLLEVGAYSRLGANRINAVTGKHGAGVRGHGVPGSRGLCKTQGVENAGSRGLWKTRGLIRFLQVETENILFISNIKNSF